MQVNTKKMLCLIKYNSYRATRFRWYKSRVAAQVIHFDVIFSAQFFGNFFKISTLGCETQSTYTESSFSSDISKWYFRIVLDKT